MKSALILLAHGSRDARWQSPFLALASDLNLPLAFLEMTTPTLADVMQAQMANGANHIRVLPLFMASGGAHVNRDIPQLLLDARAQYPQVTFEQLPALGEHPEVQAVFRRVIQGLKSS
ncbi:MAG: CbiX/SirB N-terminal domain-containing protein [Vampirovibrionales bacterium]|nr:CbiX/SirB N-terminal domain-containing protein [Vampirovibrionales bacterium]